MAILPDELFNADWYLSQNPDVADAIANNLFDSAWDHFQKYGKTEGRDPSPIFDTHYYLLNNPDVNEAVKAGLITAYDHFTAYGAGEARSPLRLFEPEFYLAQNPDVAAAVEAGLISATEHFLLFGQNEPRYISPFVDLGAYLDANSDVKAAVESAGVQPLDHLLTFGFAEGRDLGNGVDLALFANDPTFLQAIEQGDVHSAMNRVGEVAPFLPDFKPPPSWAPSSDTPIPVDFIPPEGVKLVVPPGVYVPPGMILPDTFEPIAPPDSDGGGEPTPNPEDDGALKIIGVAGRATGGDGQYREGDSIVIAFSHTVFIDETRFNDETLAKFGEGFTLSPIGIEEVFPNGLPDVFTTVERDVDDDEVVLFPSAQYRLTLGADPELAAQDTITFNSGSIAYWSVTEGELLLTDADLEFSAIDSGTIVLTGPLGNTNTFQDDFLSLDAFLAHDLDYELAADGESGNLVALANLGGREGPISQHVKGSEAADIFVAFGSDTLFGQSDGELYSGLDLDGGAGHDQLLAILNLDSPSPASPSIRSVETFYLTTLTPWYEEDDYSIEAASMATLAFDNISNVETVWNLSSEGRISLTGVQDEIKLGAFNTGYGYTEYSVFYAETATVESQRLDMVDADIDQLTIGIDGESQLSVLFIGIVGLNILDSVNVSSEINRIVVENGSLPGLLEGTFYEGECGCDAPRLDLGSVWDGLTIDITGLKGNGANYVDLQLGWATQLDGTLTIVLGDEPASGPSDLTVQLMDPYSIVSGSQIIIQNASIASEGAEGAPNDVITVDGLTRDSFLSGLESLEVTAEAGFVDFSFRLDTFDGQNGIFTLTLDNLLSQAAYNKLIEEVLQAPEDDGYGEVSDAIAEGIVEFLFEEAQLFQEWTIYG